MSSRLQVPARGSEPLRRPSAPSQARPPPIRVGPASDPLEREADQAAQAVLSGAPGPLSRGAPALLRRACAGGCSGHAACDDCRKRTLRRQADGPGPDVAPPIVHEVLAKPGEPLEGSARSFMEERFSQSFADVRVHADARAAESARAVGAHAYAVGSHVVFAAGRYAPASAAGVHLLAHELAHVAQQREGAPPALRRACGSAQIGPVPSECVFATVEPRGRRFLFRTGCDEFRTGEEAALEAFVRGLPAGSGITITGMASSDGARAFNEALSCRRADAAARVVHGAGRGADIRHVRASGPMGAPGDGAFRSVDISVGPPAAQPKPREKPGPQSCPQVTVVPPSPAPHGIATRGACGTDPDFYFLDFPTLTLGEQLIVAPFRQMSNPRLQGIMSREIGFFAGGMGTAMAAHFFAASGTPLHHLPGSALSAAVSTAPTFAAMRVAAQRALDAEVLAQAGTCHVDWRHFDLLRPPRRLPALSFSVRRGDTLQLNAVLGGTQGLTIFLIGFTVPPGGRTYTALLRFEICDDFGVDNTDLDPTNIGHGSPGLVSFWVLQHERPTHRPFVNFVVVDVPVSGSF